MIDTAFARLLEATKADRVPWHSIHGPDAYEARLSSTLIVGVELTPKRSNVRQEARVLAKVQISEHAHCVYELPAVQEQAQKLLDAVKQSIVNRCATSILAALKEFP